MFKNYFKIAWRNLLKNKEYAAINVIGLAAGMAVALLIGLWTWDEISLDYYHTKHERMARAMSYGGDKVSSNIAIPLADELQAKHGSDFENLALASRNTELTIAAGDKKINTTGMWAQPALPNMLTLKIANGSLTALQDPSSALIKATAAALASAYR